MVGEHIPRVSPLCDCGIPAIAHRPSHTPKCWPICSCGARSENHRVKHHYVGDGDTCTKCGLVQKNHLGRGVRDKSQYRFDYVGIDGEGVGRDPHKYVMLCAATNEGQRWSLEDINGLKTEKTLDWILKTLDRCRVFAYGFGYDVTCILRDLPDTLLYTLLRPSLRYLNGKLRAVKWKGFSLNWLQGKLTISRGKLRVAIWDIIKFYQQTFVKSLQDWQENNEWADVIDHIEKMKGLRSTFKIEDFTEIRTYCQLECRTLAELAKKLLAAHRDAGLTLKSYYGPGSTASIALSEMNVLEYTKDPPAAMNIPIACAFFGGWFENSDMGIVKPCYGADISSAYPYHAYSLPCLKHGKWKHVTTQVSKALRGCTTALIHYSYTGKASDVWAPFPHRDSKGTITHPYRSQGWVWLPEYDAGKSMGKTRLIEAWVYNTSCKCQPFKAIADYYRRRIELGKDARGKVLKLAVNSIYGKLAQSKGPNPKYQNWIWAGLITSSTRAQVLRAIARAVRPSDVIGIATDGVFSRTPLSLESPRDTGTSDLAKPLGGWEQKEYSEGMLFLKPGIYLTLEGETTIKARGVGKKALSIDRQEIIDWWQEGAHEWTVRVDRFHGAKSSIGVKGRSSRFAQWSKMPIRMRFECPNRDKNMRLLKREHASVPYDASMVSIEALQARLHRDIAYEQP